MGPRRTSRPRKHKPGAFTLIELLIVIGIIALVASLLLPRYLKDKRAAIRIQCHSVLAQVGLAFSIWAGDNNQRYPMARFGQPGGPKNGVPPGQVLTVPTTPTNTTWAYTYEVFQVMSNELGHPDLVICPADERKARTNFSGAGLASGDFRDNTAVSYFYGKDANAGNPNMILAGDRAISATPATSKGYGVSGPTGASQGAVFALGTNFTPGASYPAWTDVMHRKNGNIAITDGSVAQVTSARLRDQAEHTNDRSEPTGRGNALVFP